LIDKYDYLAIYRLYRPASIRKLGKECGFSEFESCYSEKVGEFACYFPGPTKAVPGLWEKCVEVNGRRDDLEYAENQVAGPRICGTSAMVKLLSIMEGTG
jgi:hypothetical protein